MVSTSPARPARPFPAWRSTSAAPLGLGMGLLAALALLVTSIGSTRAEFLHVVADLRRVAELRGTILHLDEWLTMSARLAAATGHPQWGARYEEAEPRLDAAIQEAIARAAPRAAAELTATTDAANRRLVELERKAFEMVERGALAGAAEVLEGEEYAAHKQIYLSGLQAFGERLEAASISRAAELQRRAAGERLSLVALLFAGAGLGLWWHVRLRRALLRTEDVARSDALTGLLNRRALFERLEGALVLPEPRIAVLMLDLDGFKAVNDALGHAAGDELLRLVATRLRAAVRSVDVLARLGGDEFAVLLPLPPGAITTRQAEGLAGRVITSLSEPFNLGASRIARIGTSVGIALAPSHGEAPAPLLHAADLALYEAKQRGRGRHVVFEPGMESASRERAELDAALREAVRRDEIVPYFQPLVSLASGHRTGMELLARWTAPGRGVVPPSEFIPAAERLGVIVPLTESLLRRGCRAASGWAGGERLSVNIPPRLFEDARWLRRTVEAALTESGLPPHRLELELTETALVGDIEAARLAIQAVRELGVSVALDDFGTGYSGLRLLSSLPVDRLKIDAGFVRRMHDDPPSARIVASVVALAQALGIGVVGEGVENEADAAVLQALGCEDGQGWLFGRPEPVCTPDAAQQAPLPAGQAAYGSPT